MAIKKLRFNDDGLVEEKEVERKAGTSPARPNPIGPRKPPPPPPRSEPPKAKPATTVERLPIEGRTPDAGARSVRKVEDLVTKVRCPRCGSERVVSDATAKLNCGLCGSPMRLV